MLHLLWRLESPCTLCAAFSLCFYSASPSRFQAYVHRNLPSQIAPCLLHNNRVPPTSSAVTSSRRRSVSPGSAPLSTSSRPDGGSLPSSFCSSCVSLLAFATGR